MATITASAGPADLISTRKASDQWGNWTEARWDAALAFSSPIPTNARITSSVLTVHVSVNPIAGSWVYVDGQRVATGTGDKPLTIAITPGTSSRTVPVTFSGSGTKYTQAVLQLSLSLSVSYELDTTRCTPPTAISANPAAGEPGQETTLSWSGASGGVNNSIVGYTVFLGSTAIKTLNVSTAEASTSVPFSGQPGTDLSLSVSTRGGAGAAWDSDKSYPATASVTCKAPTAISLSNAFPPAGSTTTLFWSGAEGGPNAEIIGYEIYRSDNGGSFFLYRTVASVSQVEVAAPAQYGQTSTFKLRTLCTNTAYNSGLSGASATVTAGAGIMQPPTDLWVSSKAASAGGVVRLAWRGASAGDHNAISGYAIWRASAKDGAYSQIANVSMSESAGQTMVSAPQTPGTTYFFAVSTLSEISGTGSAISAASADVTALSADALPRGTGRTNAIIPEPWA